MASTRAMWRLCGVTSRSATGATITLGMSWDLSCAAAADSMARQNTSTSGGI